MANQDFTERVKGNLLVDGTSMKGPDTVIGLGIPDNDKPYAKKMENLALVRERGTGESRGNGHWLFKVLAADAEQEDLIPLYGELDSQEAKGFVCHSTLLEFWGKKAHVKCKFGAQPSSQSKRVRMKVNSPQRQIMKLGIR